MQGRRAALSPAVALAAGLFCAAGSAWAGPLGDRIAETPCYPPSAERKVLAVEQRYRLRVGPRVTGVFREIQGSEARP